MAFDKLMVVIDPSVEAQPGFDRALELARLMGARLHLYACADDATLAQSRERALTRLEALLQHLAGRAEAEGVAASTELECGDDWRRQLVRAAARCSAEMVVKSSFDHSDLQRKLRDTSDWMLLRNAPCPVLLVKSYRAWTQKCIVGAINVNSRDGAHTRLNNQIISLSSRFAQTIGSEAHFVNAYHGANHLPPIEVIALRCGVPVDHIQLTEAIAHEAITYRAEELDAGLIIIGTVGRNGIAGKVLGNTAEKLIDHTHIDVLIVN